MADNWVEEGSKGGVKDNWEDDDGNRPVKDNWEDEEDEDVKDSWDQEEEEKKEKPSKGTSSKTNSGKTNTAPARELTEEEKKEAQMRADYENAQELLGLSKSLNEFSFKTKEEYTDFIDRFYARVNIHNTAPLYVDFLDDLFKTLVKDLPTESIRKLSNNLRTLYDARLVEDKLNKAKDSKAKKGKGKIKMVRGEFDSFLKDGGAIDDRAGTYDDADDDFI